MDPLLILVIAAGVMFGLFFLGGVLGVRRRAHDQAGDLEAHIAEADRALEQARADDKGWDRQALEAAARDAVQQVRPGFSPERLDLVLVDDRPGVVEDKAHFVARAADEQVRVVLARTDAGGWTVERSD
jgi:hypothetical protein